MDNQQNNHQLGIVIGIMVSWCLSGKEKFQDFKLIKFSPGNELNWM